VRRQDSLARLLRFQQQVKYVELSGHPLFRDRYIEHMTFPEGIDVRNEGEANGRNTTSGRGGSE
jgi:hypothetical protein